MRVVEARRGSAHRVGRSPVIEASGADGRKVGALADPTHAAAAGHGMRERMCGGRGEAGGASLRGSMSGRVQFMGVGGDGGRGGISVWNVVSPFCCCVRTPAETGGGRMTSRGCGCGCG